MNASHLRLRFLLRALGAISALAIIPFVMPSRWLDVAHQSMGLGPFPSQPIAEYLARSVSSLCLFYGGLLLALSRDVARFAPIIKYQAVAIMILSAFGIYVGTHAGLAPIWLVADAVGCWIFLLPILLLSRKLASTAAS
jgi:hypothetical protein